MKHPVKSNKRFLLNEGSPERDSVKLQEIASKKSKVKKSKKSIKPPKSENPTDPGENFNRNRHEFISKNILLFSGSVNFVAECYYKTVTFSAEDFAERLANLGCDPATAPGGGGSDAEDSDSQSRTSDSRSSSPCSASSDCQVQHRGSLTSVHFLICGERGLVIIV